MKKILICAASLALGACCGCEVEPLVEENHRLIVPPSFGRQ